MEISEGVNMLEVPMGPGGEMIYPTVIWDDTDMVLVDTGLPGMLEKIQKAMNTEKLPFEKLNRVVLTHQDLDHTGGVLDILKAKGVEVLAHNEDVPYIQGEKKLVRYNSRFLSTIPEKQRGMMKMAFEHVQPLRVDTALEDGEKLPCCGGITVIHTPGHTPGHICLYHEKSRTLVAGDAMSIVDGKLSGPRKEILDDESFKLALHSLKKLEKCDVRNVVVYHGGLFNDKANERIAELI